LALGVQRDSSGRLPSAAVDQTEAVYSGLDLRIEDAGNSHATDGGRQRQDGNQERRQSSRREMLSSRLTTISPKTTLKRSCRRVTSDGQLCQLPKGLIGSGTTWTKSRARARGLTSHHRGAIIPFLKIYII
jgi:hypothetical protein